MATFIAGGFLDLRVFGKTCAAATDLGLAAPRGS
jgi:hypothetical protein